MTVSSLGRPLARIHFTDFWKAKYLLDFDGAGASFRLPSLMLGNSVVIRPEQYWYWWSAMYNGTWVEVENDLSDLIAKVKSLQRDDAYAKRYVDRMTAARNAGG